MKTRQHALVLAVAIGMGLLFTSAPAVIAQTHEHSPKKSEDQGDASEKPVMRHQLIQQMHECMRTMREGMGEQHGMMQGKGDMSREKMREQMMARMEACIESMGHSGDTMGRGGEDKPKHDHGKTK